MGEDNGGLTDTVQQFDTRWQQAVRDQWAAYVQCVCMHSMLYTYTPPKYSLTLQHFRGTLYPL